MLVDRKTVSTNPPSFSEQRLSANPFGNVAPSDNRTDVLVVEDDIAMSSSLERDLSANGFSPVAVFSGEEALSMLSARSFAIILLDCRLPACDGLEVLRVLRARDDRTPVFLMSGVDAIEERVLGFETGADDFLVKPFDPAELIARIRGRLRRALAGENLRWRLSDLVLHVETRSAYRGDNEIALTPREFDLLLYLVQRQRSVISREILGREVWRITQQTPSLMNSIDVHIAKLRRKVDCDYNVKLIHTVRGEGFVVGELPPVEDAA
jgi:two-component system, OmpR family, copper resistance phosphate regulon response regulator CusR